MKVVINREKGTVAPLVLCTGLNPHLRRHINNSIFVLTIL